MTSLCLLLDQRGAHDNRAFRSSERRREEKLEEKEKEDDETQEAEEVKEEEEEDERNLHFSGPLAPTKTHVLSYFKTKREIG